MTGAAPKQSSVMVKHLVMWRLRVDARHGQAEHATSIAKAIDAMRDGILGLQRVEIGFDRSQVADSADLVLYCEFDSWSSLQAYEAHPLHEALKRVIGPLRTERRVVDYEIT
jgi:hypothetical protein